MIQNLSSGSKNRLPKSIRILDRKKEGPKSKKGAPKSKWQGLGRAILEPRGPWGRQI